MEYYRYQIEAWKQLQLSKKVLVIAPTGRGKSLVYQRVLGNGFQGIALIISPLIALTADQKKRLVMDQHINPQEVDIIELMPSSVDIIGRNSKQVIFAAPEVLARDSDSRLRMKLLSMAERITLFVIDEAHLIILWGLTFRPAFGLIKPFYDSIRHAELRSICLTAETHPYILKTLVNDFSFESADIIKDEFVSHETRIQNIYKLQQNENIEQLLLWSTRLMLLKYERGIVFCNTIAAAHYAYEMLRQCMPNQDFLLYHSKLGPVQKENITRQISTAKSFVVISTSALGSGVNFDFQFGIHYGAPFGLIQYTQEIGRIGRHQNESEVLMLCQSSDLQRLPKNCTDLNQIHEDIDTIKTLLTNKRALVKRKELFDAVLFRKLKHRTQLPVEILAYCDHLINFLIDRQFIMNEGQYLSIGSSVRTEDWEKMSEATSEFLQFMTEDSNNLKQLIEIKDSAGVPGGTGMANGATQNHSPESRSESVFQKTLREFEQTGEAAELRVKLATFQGHKMKTVGFFEDETVRFISNYVRTPYRNHNESANAPGFLDEHIAQGARFIATEGLITEGTLGIRVSIRDSFRYGDAEIKALHASVQKQLGRSGFSNIQPIYDVGDHLDSAFGEYETLLVMERKRRTLQRHKEWARQILRRTNFQSIIFWSLVQQNSMKRNVRFPNISTQMRDQANLFTQYSVDTIADAILRNTSGISRPSKTRMRNGTRIEFGLRDSLPKFLSLMRRHVLDCAVSLRPKLGLTPKLFPVPIGDDNMNAEIRRLWHDGIKVPVDLPRKLQASFIVRLGFIPIAATQVEKFWKSSQRSQIIRKLVNSGVFWRIKGYFVLNKNLGAPVATAHSHQNHGRANAYCLNAKLVNEWITNSRLSQQDLLRLSLENLDQLKIKNATELANRLGIKRDHLSKIKNIGRHMDRELESKLADLLRQAKLI